VTGGRIRRRVLVTGRVQGVAFRAATRSKAEACGVCGWVRNRPDGSVEAVFEGDPEAVELLIAFCRTGPRLARVERIEATEEAPEGLLGFELRG
jgi:acylphosphatase